MLKRILSIMALVSACLLFMTAVAIAQDGGAETLSIRGDGVNREIAFTRAELEAMNGKLQTQYSVTNNFPTDKSIYRQGIELSDLLQQAGLKENARQLKFISSDGYHRTFTIEELLGQNRYCFAAGGDGKAAVPVMIALKDSGKGFYTMNDIEMALTMGQRVRGEQNNPWFVKKLQTIEVSTAEPEQWPQVTFKNLASGPDDVKVELKHSNFDMVKIYYTTDGTDPTINSKTYNISASYYQPHLNQPIPVTGDMEIRAVAIGAGKYNSEIANTRIIFTGTLYDDIGDYPWARQAIEELSSKGIIKGMGGNSFAPAQPLTRAQFATMMVLALEEKPYSGGRNTFSDVKTDDWHYGYVEKAVELEIINGYPDGTYRPEQALSRQEMLAVVVQALAGRIDAAEVEKELGLSFAPQSRISDWACGYVAYAEYLGILEHGNIAGEIDGKLLLDGQGTADRAEAAVTVHRMLEHKLKP